MRVRQVVFVVVLTFAALPSTATAITPPMPVVDQFRISLMGQDGDISREARDPAIAYNPASNRYLVVWSGDNVVDGEYEINGRFFDGQGNAVAPQFRISNMGPNGNRNYGAYIPAISYNPQANEYLVTWYGSDDANGMVNDEIEIFGQRLNANGNRVGTNKFRVSDMGPNGNVNYSAYFSAITYNPQANEYLVAWVGSDDSRGLVIGEYEIFGQRLNAAGNQIGANDFRISDMGPDGDANYGTFWSPAITYNTRANEYLVTWQGDDNSGGLVVNEIEIFGQRLTSNGTHTGTNDFRISDMGPDGGSNYDAYIPAISYNSQANEYLVTWNGDDNSGGLVDEELEIFGQRLTSNGTQTGNNDFRISDMGPNDNANYDAYTTETSYNSRSNEYLITWHGDDNSNGMVNDEFEIFGQRLTSDGRLVGDNDFRISEMGPNLDVRFGTYSPAISYNSQNNEYLVAWQGDDDTGNLVSNEFEIFGRRLGADGPLPRP